MHKILNIEYSPAPHFDLEEEFQLQQFVSNIIKEKLIESAHDISEGGLMITLLEKGFNRNLGFNIISNEVRNLSDIRNDAFWFGEAQSRVVVTVKENRIKEIEDKCKASNISITKLGTVTSKEIIIDENNCGNIIDWKEKYDTAIEKILN